MKTQLEGESMKKMICLLISIIMSMSLLVPAFAQQANIGSGVAVKEPETQQNNTGWNYDAPDSAAEVMGIKPVSAEDVANRLNKKGNDVVNILQTVGKWVCMAAFVVCIIMMVAGCVGNRKLIMQGLIGMIIAGIAYAGIVCGREIVIFIASWAAA